MKNVEEEEEEGREGEERQRREKQKATHSGYTCTHTQQDLLPLPPLASQSLPVHRSVRQCSSSQ